MKKLLYLVALVGLCTLPACRRSCNKPCGPCETSCEQTCETEYQQVCQTDDMTIKTIAQPARQSGPLSAQNITWSKEDYGTQDIDTTYA